MGAANESAADGFRIQPYPYGRSGYYRIVRDGKPLPDFIRIGKLFYSTQHIGRRKAELILKKLIQREAAQQE